MTVLGSGIDYLQNANNALWCGDTSQLDHSLAKNLHSAVPHVRVYQTGALVQPRSGQ